MKTMIAKLCTAAITVALLSAVPANAASFPMSGAQVQNAQFSFGIQSNNNDDRGRFERRGSNYYYNGQRGYRERRSGYRHYNGFWFPNSAFSFSFSINSDRYRGRDHNRLSQRHVDWCQDHYRSYRTSDNTFQPFNGARQDCVSPYSS